MPTFDEARQIILANIRPLGVERVSILEAVGRVLAVDIVAPWCMPQCDNSAMDGFAVRSDDCSSLPASLRITGYIPAGGDICGEVEPGCAIRIMTGAPVPPGCDAVVPVEETREEGGEVVSILEPVKSGQHIRFTAEDVQAGETIIPAGTLLRTAEISMLASFGRALVPVHRRARVAILSTGDELVEMGEPLTPGRIINSNSLSLAAAVREIGAEPVILGIARDNRESHRSKMVEGLKADALITSAGVSAGDRDLVRIVLDELGLEQLFWKVEMKPGGPTAFGTHDGRPVFSLPGNPVSSMITFEAFARPALLKMMGHSRLFRPVVTATLKNDLKKKPGKLNLIRVTLESDKDGFRASSSGVQQTALLKTMLRADALAVFPADLQLLEKGARVQCIVLREELLMGCETDKCSG